MTPPRYIFISIILQKDGCCKWILLICKTSNERALPTKLLIAQDENFMVLDEAL